MYGGEAEGLGEQVQHDKRRSLFLLLICSVAFLVPRNPLFVLAHPSYLYTCFELRVLDFMQQAPRRMQYHSTKGFSRALSNSFLPAKKQTQQPLVLKDILDSIV